LTTDVGLIRVVVRREAPAIMRMAIRRPVVRARSVRTTSEFTGLRGFSRRSGGMMG